MKALFEVVFIESERERGLGIEVAKAPGASFEMNRNVAINDAALPHHANGIGPLPTGRAVLIILQDGRLVGGEFDLDVQKTGLGEKRVGVLCVTGSGGRSSRATPG